MRVAHVAALRAEPLADARLAAPAAVGVGGVERRDAQLPGGVQEPERLLAARALSEERRRRADPAEVPAAEDDARHGDPAPSQRPLLHGTIVCGRARAAPPIGIGACPPNTPPWATTTFRQVRREVRGEAAPFALAILGRERAARAREPQRRLGALRHRQTGGSGSCSRRRPRSSSPRSSSAPHASGSSASSERSRSDLLVLLGLGTGVATLCVVVSLTNWTPSGPQLLLSAVVVLLTNVITYALAFWELDDGGPIAACARRDARPSRLPVPAGREPGARTPRLGARARRLPLSLADELRRVQPDRRDAAHAPGEARHGARGVDLAGDHPRRRRTRDQRARLAREHGRAVRGRPSSGVGGLPPTGGRPGPRTWPSSRPRRSRPAHAGSPRRRHGPPRSRRPPRPANACCTRARCRPSRRCR